MNYRNTGKGDGRWIFIVGGCWWIRTSAIRELDWPDPRLAKEGDDVYLGEAIRQQGWEMAHVEAAVGINQSLRRGDQGLASAQSLLSGDGD